MKKSNFLEWTAICDLFSDCRIFYVREASSLVIFLLTSRFTNLEIYLWTDVCCYELEMRPIYSRICKSSIESPIESSSQVAFPYKIFLLVLYCYDSNLLTNSLHTLTDICYLDFEGFMGSILPYCYSYSTPLIYLKILMRREVICEPYII